ncbi:uncharacterized protein C8Q71DRAFT_780708 [Rhodofomes roseus]|uniref:SWIM-type domain-containing protein n=1 Tax=Rhodofomes roseus TaxID=34475 RepID=A0ABQ8K5P0_9APHY|nr:uncharacterized protein C8Q71DRAFT_780708 [Rhodofomes roseus]KAH9831839.1 hypothetical protein C8Q71DRAFT_780708 [Rhodofomes roseus]
MQEAFKRSWERLAKVPIKGTYITNINKWTCDCGAQKYHAYLLCKHLVHATGDLPALWWVQVQRYHVPPFYTVPINGTIASPPESSTKHAWLDRMPNAATELEPKTPSPVKSSKSKLVYDGVESETEMEESALPSIDSSPNKAPPTGRDGLLRTRAGGSGGFALDDEDAGDVREQARLLRRAADILEEQHELAEPRFIKNAMRATRSAAKWAQDIDKHEHRRTMPITNAVERGQALPSNVIGYKYIARR